ncbi:DNA polymerase III subunit gamma/tau [Salipiger pallidus]|uniref:DNA polymerase III subunit gamma/tau n=1 Tax=Salipiger pallidus TaxID=1775170 RepID=A0A8J2ZKH2_9RHOB|nr:SRPBCC family protein [Salipiger pallidus]GGG73875.1 DNA polymerase III subunit gamma/tau [Salipiger pallidus]
MEFSTREDIEAPAEQVFAELTRFEQIERQVMRRGVDLQRTSGSPDAPEELAWTARFKLRGKERTADITLDEYDAPNRLTYKARSGGLDAVTVIDVMALSRGRTRIVMTFEVLPQTLSARLMVQSMKLARGNMEKKFRVKMAEYARDLETRLNRPA